MLRVLHIGLGPLGRKIVGELHARGVGRVVAAVDVSPELAGRPLRDIVPEAGSVTPMLPSLDAVTDWKSIDAVMVTTSSTVGACEPTFRALLARGMPVVSTCEELVWPWLRAGHLADALDAQAKQTGGRLIGTGVNPGFLMDALPVCLTAVSSSVTSVRCARVQDATTRRVPFQAKIGASLSRDQFDKRLAAGGFGHVGLGESLHFVAHYLGLGVTSWEEKIGPIISERSLSCALGPIPVGGVAGIHQIATGRNAAGHEVISLEFAAAIGHANPHDRVVIEGSPRIDLTIAGGVHGDVATSAIAINALPRIVAAAPGLHTMATLPMPHLWRA